MPASTLRHTSREIVPFEPGVELLRDMVIFDLETTGLSPASDDIIQIAALRMVDGTIRPRDRFSTFVKPGRPIDPFITGLTGITDDDVRDAPTAADAVGRFSAFCARSLLVAHNGHAFDIPFLQQAATANRRVRYIDSMHLSWQVWGRSRGISHSLDGVVARLRVDSGDVRRHDARGDVELLARCVQKLLGRMADPGGGYKLSVYECSLPGAGSS